MNTDRFRQRATTLNVPIYEIRDIMLCGKGIVREFPVPQNLKQIYIIGHLGVFDSCQVFPLIQEKAVSAKANRCQEGKEATFTKGKIRRLTPLECERLQGFPDGWTAKGVSE